MSVPTVLLSCVRCGENFTRGVLYGYFEYELTDGARISLERRLGWCGACKSMVAMESLDPEAAARRRAKIADQLAGIKGFSAWLPSGRRAAAYYRQELDALDRQLAFFKQRVTAPRCLSCGSTEVAPLPSPPDAQEDAPAIPAGWTHPGCGGEMQASKSSLRFIFNHPLRIYDANGTFVRETEYERP